MKFKITIPAQSLRIEIPAQEIEMDFQPIWEIDPPVIPEPPIKPEPPIEDVFDLDAFLLGKSGVVYLPEYLSNKESVISSKGMIKPNQVTALIGEGSILTFENWDVSPTQVFDLSGCSEFGVVGITFVCPPNRPIVTGFPDKEVFGWNRDTVNYGKFAYINGSEIVDKERVTYGLCRFGYSSINDGRIYLIGKNITHNGFNFTQIKNPYSGNLWLILQNVKVNNPIIEAPQSHYYSPTRVKVRVMVQGGVAKIISDNKFSQIWTWMGYNNGNQRSILHFDRYVYDISEGYLIDDKTLIIDRDDEFHPNDNIQGLGKVITKQIDETRQTNWIYTYQSNDLPTQKTLQEGEFEAYICYKGNAAFFYPIDVNTKFGDWWVTLSQGYGWTWYNEEFSGYIENFEGSGYFRNSGGSGITQGLTIVDSYFEQNGPISNSSNPMPEEAEKYINYLESLAI